MQVSIAIVLFVSSFVAALANVDQMREDVQKGGTGGGGVGGASSGSPIEATAPATTGTGSGTGTGIGTPTIGTGTGTGAGATTGDKLNATQCIYKSEEKKLSCQSDSETFVECPTIGEWSMLDSHKFQIFGLSTPRCMMSAGECPPQSTVFRLHPRKPDNETYSSHTIVSNKTGKAVDMMLWGSSGSGSGEPAMAGLRVSDVKCFERLVKLNAETCRTPRTFRIVQNATASEEVTLCGEILVADKALQKRWFGWGGLGMWGWGWPYWGFGAPLLWGR